MRLISSFVFVLAFCCSIPAWSHAGGESHKHDGLIAEWFFQPNYSLPGNAAVSPPQRANPEAARIVLQGEPVAQRFLGAEETGRYGNLLTGTDIPADAFTVELWLLEHVNTDVGALAGVFSGPGKRKSHWALGFLGRTLVFGALAEGGANITIDVAEAELEAYKSRWIQLVGSWDGEMLRLYHNGRLVAAKTLEAWPESPRDAGFDLISYTGTEPYMAFENLVQGARVFDHALSPDAIKLLFEGRTADVDAGIVHPGRFHFTAGPYLNAPTETSISLIVETDRTAELTVHYGTDPEAMAIKRSDESRLHAVTLDGLAPNTTYFYEVIARDATREEISSGLLTFQTAVEAGRPFRFAIIGDTEARPFVNNAVAQGVWDARPHFGVLLGDLTDGGFEERRFEWTHEFFAGVGPLAARVPMIAAPGNGEADLYWYRHYHNLPGEENFYAWRYGDAEFFVLDSNLGDREREEPGFRARQQAWLADALAVSNAKWKIAVHHHPVYTSDEDDYGDSWREAGREIGDSRVRNDFMELYDQYDVDVVLYGHMHVYERSHPMRGSEVDVLDGVIYIGAGGGGGNREDFTPTRQSYSATTYRGYHYGLFDVSGDTVRYELRDTEGRIRDTLTLVKQDAGRAVVLEQAVANSP